MPNDWISEQIELINSLKNKKIKGFVATEMAFQGGEENEPPQFENASLPFLQVCPLYIYLEQNKKVKFVVYQDNDVFGIYLSANISSSEDKLDPGSFDSIYRTRKLDNFPTGLVTSIEIRKSLEGNISEIELHFDDDAILLVAGEVQETWDGNLRVIRDDESILLFRNPKLKSVVKFV